MSLYKYREVLLLRTPSTSGETEELIKLLERKRVALDVIAVVEGDQKALDTAALIAPSAKIDKVTVDEKGIEELLRKFPEGLHMSLLILSPGRLPAEFTYELRCTAAGAIIAVSRLSAVPIIESTLNPSLG